MRAYWKNAVDGDFEDQAAWSTGLVPVKADRVSLRGSNPYTVSVSSDQQILTLETGATATFDILGGPLLVFGSYVPTTFTISGGTGTGFSAGTINVEARANLMVGGIFRNSGSINLQGSAADGGAYLYTIGTLTLTGGGHVNVSGGGIVVNSTQTQLINIDNVISLFGADGGTQIQGNIVNRAHGIIDHTGDQSADLNGGGAVGKIINSGTIQSTGGGDLRIGEIANSGLIKATNGSMIHIGGDIDLTNTSTGVIEASGTGSEIWTGNASGGTFKTSDGGQIHVGGLDGAGSHPITNMGDLIVGGKVEGTIHNKGSIVTEGNCELGSSLVLDGKGEFSMDGWGLSTAIDAAATITNVDNTIFGDGYISGGTLNIVNRKAGVIEARADEGLVIDTGDGALTNAGVLQAVDGGSLLVSGTVMNSGSLKALGGSLIFADKVTGGKAIIGDDGDIEFGAIASTSVNFAFAADGELILGNSAKFTGKITGFGQGDSIDLLDIEFDAQTTMAFASNVLTVSDGVDVAKLRFGGGYVSAEFEIADNGHGGTVLTDLLLH